MKPLEDLLTHVMPKVRNCAEPTAMDALRNAATAFCETTRMWRYEDKFTVSKTSYDVICAPADAVLHEIESARFDERPLEVASLSWLDQVIPRWREDEGETATYLTQTEPNAVRLVPLCAGTLDLTLYLKPSPGADRLPDFLVDQYYQVLAHGALEILHLIPGQDFFSADLATYHSRKFEQRLSELSSMQVRGQQRAPVRTQAQYF